MFLPQLEAKLDKVSFYSLNYFIDDYPDYYPDYYPDDHPDILKLIKDI